MTDTKAKLLFEAIVKDDLKSFNNLLGEQIDLKLRFGRFPMLSVCYLFKSYKILNKYEDRLCKINDYIKVYEPLELCRRFDKLAKKALRIYLNEDAIVQPIEMLAILDKRKWLVSKYIKLYKNDKIVSNIKKIYILNNNLDIFITYNQIKIKTKSLSFKQKLTAICWSLVLVITMLLSSGTILFISNITGLGLKNNPIKITNESELISALENGKNYYKLERDIELTKYIDSFDFSGELDGNGHTIDAGDKLVNGLTKNNSGTIKNLNLKVDYSDLKLNSDFGIISNNSTGKIENCKILGSVNLEVTAKQDIAGEQSIEIYFANFAVTNSGNISGCESAANVVAKNENNVNVFVSGIAGKNLGVIEDCQVTAKEFVCDTVDIAGVVIENSGTIINSENKVALTQSASSNTWNPNIAGIAITNRGRITECKNTGRLVAESTAENLQNNNLINVLIAGIAINNFNVIEGTANVGDIEAISIVAEISAAGIVCQNVSEGNVRAKVLHCNSACNLVAEATGSDVYVAGIVSQSSGDIVGSTFSGKIKTSGNEVFAAGVCSFSLYSLISGCKVNVSFDAEKFAETQNNYTVCAVAMFVWDNADVTKIPESFSSENNYFENDTFDSVASRLIRIFINQNSEYVIVGFRNYSYENDDCGCKPLEVSNDEINL